jgi:nicotinamide-nucleotide amidase
LINNSSVIESTHRCFVTDEDLPLPNVVSKILKNADKLWQPQKLHRRIYCTPNYSTGGSSEYYKGGVVSYANSMKEDVLHVSPKQLEAVGAVVKLL